MLKIDTVNTVHKKDSAAIRNLLEGFSDIMSKSSTDLGLMHLEENGTPYETREHPSG